MALDPVLAFWAICLLLIIVPGADWAFVISAGLGGRSVVPAVGGLVLGYTALTAVVAAGAGTLVARSPVLLTALTVAGGAYLVWRGAMTLASPAPALDPVPDTSPGTARPHPGPRSRRERAHPQGLAAVPGPAAAVRRPARKLAAARPAGPARDGVHGHLRNVLPGPGLGGAGGAAAPPLDRARRHPPVRRGHDRDRRGAAGRAVPGLTRWAGARAAGPADRRG